MFTIKSLRSSFHRECTHAKCFERINEDPTRFRFPRLTTRIRDNNHFSTRTCAIRFVRQ